MKDLFADLFRLNEEYHNSKEQATWVAATLYLAFSVGAIAWLLEDTERWQDYPAIVSVVVAVLCALTTVFLVLQNWNRVRSVVISGQMRTFMSKLDGGATYEGLQQAMDLPDGESFTERLRHYFAVGKMGNTLIAAVLALGAVQFSVVVRVGGGGTRMEWPEYFARIVPWAMFLGGIGVGFGLGLLVGWLNRARWADSARAAVREIRAEIEEQGKRELPPASKRGR